MPLLDEELDDDELLLDEELEEELDELDEEFELDELDEELLEDDKSTSSKPFPPPQPPNTTHKIMVGT